LITLYADPLVSRCGMVFMEPGALGFVPVLQSWIEDLRSSLKIEEGPDCDSFEENMKTLVDRIVVPSIRYVRKNIKEPVATTDVALFHSFLRLVFASLQLAYKKDCEEVRDSGEGNGISSTQSKLMESLKHMDRLTIFCLIWSVGASGDANGRRMFDDYLRNLVEKEDFVNSDILPAASLYEMRMDEQNFSWIPWIPSNTTNQDETTVSDSLVTTLDTIRYSYLFELLVKSSFHVLLAGPTGTGKTAIANACLKRMESMTMIPVNLNFSARTTSAQVQSLIDARLSKRRKGIFGPPVGSRMLVFVDDLNMPQAESTGAQPPLELLRQWMDYGGWYDKLQVGRFNQIQDLVHIAAMVCLLLHRFNEI
jgi:dynein heavy chain